MADSIPALLMERAAQTPNGIALLEKEYGRWVEVTWAGYAAAVRAVAIGLADLGVQPGDAVVLIAENSNEWLFVDLGAQAAGARIVGVPATTPPGELAFILGDSGAKWVVVGDQEQADKLLDALEDRPSLAVDRVLYIKEKGVSSYQEPFLISYRSVAAKGAELDESDPARFDSMLAARKRSDQAIVTYTSGTTGIPKGVSTSNGTIVDATASFHAAFPMTSKDRVLAWVSLAHPSIRGPQAYVTFHSGAVVAFPESPATFHEALNEIAPTSVMCPPRFLEVTAAEIQVRMTKSTFVKRRLFNLGVRLGGSAARKQREKGSVGVLGGVQRTIGWWLAGKAVLDKLGLDKTKWALAGGASISRDLLRFFHGLGLPLRQVYGQAETSGIAVAQYADGPIVPGVAGTALPGMEARVSEQGALLIKGPGVADAYVGAGAGAIVDSDGWFHTGDLADMTDSGELVLLDRESAIMRLTDGTRVLPTEIENSLKFSPYVAHAVLVADGRPYPTALVQIEFSTVSEWAHSKGEAFTTFGTLAVLEVVEGLIRDEVAKANGRLEGLADVRDVRVLPRELRSEEGELTPNGRVKRGAVVANFSALVDEMYAEASAQS